METKLPLISYVVKTQFITNNSGLRRIHQQVFTNQDILFAREKAFEYYEAAINVLEREGEIWRDEKTSKIIYKNPENYLKGISIYIRINEDVKKYDLADKENQMYLINIHFSLNEILKRHIEQLGNKNYQHLYEMESPDFVLLFIPIEPAFAIALNEDTQLYNKAFEKNIVIVTPSTLLATLRTIDSMWTNQKQQDNAIEIARQAGALYDKFEGFVTDLVKIGKKMDEAKSEYEGAMNKLVDGKGNLITSVQKLKIMGAKAKKSLPDVIINRANTSLENLEEE